MTTQRPDEPLSAGEVARRLGIAVTTLRTWHQRYDLGPSDHQAGQHRRYTPEDLARLEIMRRLTARGVPAATAARVARGTEPDPDAPAHHGGGHTIPVGQAGSAARGLARAAMRLDHDAMHAEITAALAAQGVLAAWDHLICPVLRGIGERHARTQRLVEVEHLLSRCVSEALAAVTRPAAPAAVLLACADEEQHTLPLEALAAALAERGTPCRLLGARVPPTALRTAVDRTGPRVVVIWSQTAHTADPDQLAALLQHPAPAAVAAAGPGWTTATLPPGIHTPQQLDDAIRLIAAWTI